MKIHWWEFPNRRTCHRNVLGLTFDESYLGEVYNTNYGWTYRLKDGEEHQECFLSYDKASKALLVAVGGEPMTTWD